MIEKVLIGEVVKYGYHWNSGDRNRDDRWRYGN